MVLIGCGARPASAPAGGARVKADDARALVRCALGGSADAATVMLTCASAAPDAPLAYQTAFVELVDGTGAHRMLTLATAGASTTASFHVADLPLTATATLVSQPGGNDAFRHVAVLVAHATLAAPGAGFAMAQPFAVWTATLRSDKPRLVTLDYALPLAPLDDGQHDTVEVEAALPALPGTPAILSAPVPLGATSLVLTTDDGHVKLTASLPAPGSYDVDDTGVHPSGSPPAMTPTDPPPATPPPAMPPTDPPPAACGTDGQPYCSDGNCASGYVWTGAQCVACGRDNQPYCSDGNCAGGYVWTGAQCVACGRDNQPYCSDGNCAAGYAWSGTSCQPAGN